MLIHSRTFLAVIAGLTKWSLKNTRVLSKAQTLCHLRMRTVEKKNVGSCRTKVEKVTLRLGWDVGARVTCETPSCYFCIYVFLSHKLNKTKLN